MQSKLSKPVVRGGIKQLNFTFPTVRNRGIQSFEGLKNLIDNKFPRVKHLKNYPHLIAYASLHLELLHLISKKKSIDSSEISLLSRDLGIPRKTVVDWLVKGKQPKIYRILEGAYSKSEAQSVVNRILKNISPIECIEDLDEQYNWFYLTG